MQNVASIDCLLLNKDILFPLIKQVILNFQADTIKIMFSYAKCILLKRWSHACLGNETYASTDCCIVVISNLDFL